MLKKASADFAQTYHIMIWSVTKLMIAKLNWESFRSRNDPVRKPTHLPNLMLSQDAHMLKSSGTNRNQQDLWGQTGNQVALSDTTITNWDAKFKCRKLFPRQQGSGKLRSFSRKRWRRVWPNLYGKEGHWGIKLSLNLRESLLSLICRKVCSSIL